MVLTTVQIGKTGGEHTSFIAIDPAEYADTAEVVRAILTGRNLQMKYIDGLLTITQKEYLAAQIDAGNTTIDLVTMP